MKRQMEIYFGTSLASIPRALRVYQIVKTDLSLVEMCYEGDLEGIQAAFANGSISPYAADEDGWSLLTVRTSCKLTHVNAELCSDCCVLLPARVVFVSSEIGFRSRSSFQPLLPVGVKARC